MIVYTELKLKNEIIKLTRHTPQAEENIQVKHYLQHFTEGFQIKAVLNFQIFLM